MANNKTYDEAKSRIKSIKEAKDVNKNIDDLKQSGADAFADSKKNVNVQLDKMKEAISGGTESIKKYQQEAKSQFQQLIGLFAASAGSGLDSTKFLKKRMIQAWRKVQPEIRSILVEESFKAVGCAQEQSYDPNQVLYVKLKSIDLFGQLKTSPDSDQGKLSYEKKNITYNSFPFSMNRELFERIKTSPDPFNVNGTQSYLNSVGSYYKGRSGQNLFDIKYVVNDPGGVYGPWFEIKMQNRDSITSGTIQNTNRIKDFMVDYYSTIQIVDTINLFSKLMNSITGCVDIQAKVSTTEIGETTKLGLFIQRVLGLCFDSKQEIDVQGSAKLAEVDQVDDSFFQLSELDLRFIDEKINDTRNGVVEFEGCDGIKLPLDYDSVISSLLSIEENASITVEEQNQLIESLTESVTNNQQWSLLIPTGLDIKVKVNLDFINEIPKAIIYAILSPKILLPIMIVLKVLNQFAIDTINSLSDFLKNFKTFFINLVSKIGALFVRELFKLIKKDIMQLIQSIAKDLTKEKVLKKYAIILSLIELATLIVRLINDWRQCKSVLDEIFALLKLAQASVGNLIPLPLLALSQLSAGFSPTRAFVNTIEEMQKLGLPTGPMPDGSPNTGMIARFSAMKGHDKEESQNGKVEVFFPGGGPYSEPKTLSGKKI